MSGQESSGSKLTEKGKSSQVANLAVQGATADSQKVSSFNHHHKRLYLTLYQISRNHTTGAGPDPYFRSFQWSFRSVSNLLFLTDPKFCIQFIHSLILIQNQSQIMPVHIYTFPPIYRFRSRYRSTVI